MQGEDSDSDGCDLDFDCGIWRLKPRLANPIGGSCLMPALQAWSKPPGMGREGNMKELKSCSRKMFQKIGNSPAWISALATPKTSLEQFALDVFWFHVRRLGWTPKAITRLGRAAGAEYWIQRRLASQARCERGVNWHFDKDEDLLDDCGIFVHPLVATATYLTNKGAPLVVLTRPTLAADEDGAPQADAPHLRGTKEAFVAFPSPGLHVAFRGNLIHGAPPHLEACKGERLNILLNVWLRHRPLSMKRSSIGLHRRRHFGPHNCRGPRPGRLVRIRNSHRTNTSSCDAINLTPDVGSWELNGVNLPRDLPSKGVWRVSQTSSLKITHGSRKRKHGN